MWSKQFIRNFSRFFRSHQYPLYDIIFISLLGSNSFLGPQRRISSWQLIVAQVRKSACTFSSTPVNVTTVLHVSGPVGPFFTAQIPLTSPTIVPRNSRPAHNFPCLLPSPFPPPCKRIRLPLQLSVLERIFIGSEVYFITRVWDLSDLFCCFFFFVICFERVKLN